jgi:predicted RNA-binding Zn-ribbon protein involved in translation (DUF1610 family)
MKNTTERIFQCPECGEKMTAYKKSSRRTAVGHIKTMWCYRCKSERQFVQIKY